MALLETAQFSQILRAPENLAPDVADRTGNSVDRGMPELLDDNVDALDHVVAHPQVSPRLLEGLRVACTVARPNAELISSGPRLPSILPPSPGERSRWLLEVGRGPTATAVRANLHTLDFMSPGPGAASQSNLACLNKPHPRGEVRYARRYHQRAYLLKCYLFA